MKENLNQKENKDTIIKEIHSEDIVLKLLSSKIVISGNITQKNPENYLKEFLEYAHNYIVENKKKEFNVDILNLRFLNSGGIKILVDWIETIQKLDKEKKYKIYFICHKKSIWQQTCINTLKIVDKEIVNIKLSS